MSEPESLLAFAERHVRECEERVARQEERVVRLERRAHAAVTSQGRALLANLDGPSRLPASTRSSSATAKAGGASPERRGDRSFGRRQASRLAAPRWAGTRAR